MNDVFETLSGAFESLRNDTGGREYYQGSLYTKGYRKAGR